MVEMICGEIDDIFRLYAEEGCHAIQTIAILPLIQSSIDGQDVQFLPGLQGVRIIQQNVVIAP